MAAAAEGTPTNDRLLYRIPEVASQLNVSRSKVYELMASGALRSVKVDRTRLVRGRDLRAFVDALEPSLPRSVQNTVSRPS
jgi:excisionase family DNA binding protein